MLAGKETRYLRSLAHNLNPIFQVGKGGVNDHLIKHIEEALEVRELIKITVLNNSGEDRKEVGTELAEKAKAELVQVIGKIVVLYKESKDQKKIVLPK
jgi:RNA-binding protein